MKLTQKNLAAQLYTLRDYAKTPAEIADTLKKVKVIGYDAVQVSGLGPIDPVELKKILDGEGLVCCATHDGGDAFFDATNDLIDKLHTLNCKHVAFPYPYMKPQTEAEWLELAKRLNVIGAQLRAEGITLTYHNHNLELVRFSDKTVLELMYETTDPENLQAEIDTYWIQMGGCDVIEWCARMKNRLPLLHLKDCGVRNMETTMMEIGYGNLKWKDIIRTADESGCEWYIVEQDICPASPFDSLKKSYDYTVTNLF